MMKMELIIYEFKKTIKKCQVEDHKKFSLLVKFLEMLLRCLVLVLMFKQKL
jgi:hypothetical protein